MLASEVVSWSVIAAVALAVLSTRRWITTLPVTHVRAYLLDVSWCVPVCIVTGRLISEDLLAALLAGAVLGPIVAARSVLFDVFAGRPPTDPDAVPEHVRRERDELRAQFMPKDTRRDP